MDIAPDNPSYYIVVQDQKKGPFDLTALQTMRQQGTLVEDSLLWAHGMPQWQPARTVVPQMFATAAASLGNAEIAVSPSTAVAPGAGTEKLVLADIGQRVMAGLIDVCVLTALQGLVGVLAFFTAGAGLIAEIAPFLYMTVPMAGEWQASLGMKLCGLRVVGYSGERIMFGPAAIRYLVSIISLIFFFIGYLMLFFTERRQTLHDMAAKILVVRAR